MNCVVLRLDMTHQSKNIHKKYKPGERYSPEAVIKMREANYERWVKKSKAKFGDRYDYSKAKSQYVKQKIEVLLRCSVHDHEFPITPDRNLQTKTGGCIHCKREGITATTIKDGKKKFLDWFKDNQAKYVEIVSDFKGMGQPLNFKCKEHNNIEAYLPTLIMHGNTHKWACSKCTERDSSYNRRSSPDELIEELTPLLPANIKINDVIFDEDIRATLIIAECNLHGKQPPHTKDFFRKSPTKCVECSKLLSGYTNARLERLINTGDKGEVCHLAVMEMEVFDIRAMKVGVTTRTLQERYAWYLKEIFHHVQLFEIDAIVLENRIKVKFSGNLDKRILFAGMRNGERWSGDTEFYRFNQRKNIINYINRFIDEELPNGKISYEKELGLIVIPKGEPIKFDRGKYTDNLPVPVVGVDPKTHEILYECESIEDAHRLGFFNIAMVISENYKRQLSGGVQWFRRSEFDPNDIPIIHPRQAKQILCVEKNIHFRSTIEAEKYLRSKGFTVTGSRISSVLNGRRKKAGGFSFERSKLSNDEIVKQEHYTNRDSVLCVKPKII
jgi:hypothetical protein